MITASGLNLNLLSGDKKMKKYLIIGAVAVVAVIVAKKIPVVRDQLA